MKKVILRLLYKICVGMERIMLANECEEEAKEFRELSKKVSDKM